MPPKGKVLPRATAKKGPSKPQQKKVGGDESRDTTSSRSSSISLPVIQRIGSLNGSAASVALMEGSTGLPTGVVPLHSSSGSGGNTSLPSIAPTHAAASGGVSPPMPSAQALMNAALVTPRVPMPPTSGTARRLSKRSGGKGTLPSGGGRLLVAPPPPQPSESDVLRISHWWSNIQMRFRIRNHAPSELARMHVLEQLAQRRQRVQRAKSIVENFLLRCASKLRQFVSAKRMVMLREVSTVIGMFAKVRVSQRLAASLRVAQLRRSGALMVKYWRSSRMYRRREHRVSHEQQRDQIVAEESLERREVGRREKLAFLEMQHEWAVSPQAQALLRALVKQRLATGAGGGDTLGHNSESTFGCLWGDDLGDVSTSVASGFPEGKVSMRRLRKGSHKTVDLAAFGSSSRGLLTSGTLSSKKSLRKNSLLVQQLSRNGSINLDAMLGGAKGHRASLGGGKGAPVSGRALSLKNDSPQREACAAGLTFFGDNVDHLESVTSSPLLHEYSRRIGAAAASKDRALADARLQLLNQQFLYPLRPSSLTIPAAQPKLCVSETFLGDAWAAWYATASLSQLPASPKHGVAPSRRRSVVIRKRVGGEYFDAQRRLSAAVGRSHSPSIQSGISLQVDGESAGGASTPSGGASAAWGGRFASRRNTQLLGRSMSNMGGVHSTTLFDTTDSDGPAKKGLDVHSNSANVVMTAAAKKAGPLVADSALFSIEMETERLLVQEHSQRMRLCAQVQRLLVDTYQRFEAERHAELADLMVPPGERVHARGVVQQEMFRYGLL